MQGVNVFENGIGYLAQCLNKYTSGSGFLLLYALGVLYILARGSKEEKEIFLPGAFLSFLTIYNPLFPVVLDKIFDVSSEYYRFFWIAPVIVLVPFAIVKLFNEALLRKEKIKITAFVIAAFILSGHFVYAEGFMVAQNIVKIPDELIEISQIIHEDDDKEYSKAYFEYNYNMEIRQYDPKMLLTVDREEYLYAVAYSYTENMIYDENAPVNAILALLTRNQDVDSSVFIRALESTKTEYVVLSKGHPRESYVRKAGLVKIAETASHTIYKYDIKEPEVFELVDYSEAEHRFSPRRLK